MAKGDRTVEFHPGEDELAQPQGHEKGRSQVQLKAIPLSFQSPTHFVSQMIPAIMLHNPAPPAANRMRAISMATASRMPSSSR